MSRAVAGRVTKAVGKMLALADVPEAGRMVLNPVLGYKQKQCKLTFITLTNPSPQRKTEFGEYDDSGFKEVLGRFLEELKRVYGVQSYIWVVEPQRNGNAHAHILIDKYIENLPEGHLKDDSVALRLTKSWNRHLRAADYIEPYAEQQRTRYATGFVLDQCMTQERREWDGAAWAKRVEVVSEEVQRKRWVYGVATDWQEPNSVDIHALYKAENVAGYIAAYMTKSDGVRPMGGRLWGHSSELDNVQVYQEEYSDELRASVTALVEAGRARVLLVTAVGLMGQQEYEDNDLARAGVAVLSTVYSWKEADWWAVAPLGYVRRYRAHWREQFVRIYGAAAVPLPALRVAVTHQKKEHRRGAAGQGAGRHAQ